MRSAQRAVGITLCADVFGGHIPRAYGTGVGVGVVICPVDCIPHDPNHVENESDLLAKYKRITGQ